MILLHTFGSHVYGFWADVSSHSHNVKHLPFLIQIVRDNLRAFAGQLRPDKPCHIALCYTVPHNAYCHISGRHHSEQHNDDNIHSDVSQAFGIYKFFVSESQHANTKKGCGADKYRVDEIKIERTDKIRKITNGNAIASGTKWGHQRSGDGYARNDVSFALGAQSYDARGTTANSYQHVVKCGRGASQKLRLGLGNRTQAKIKRGGEHADSR